MWKAARYHKGIALSLAEIQQQKESVYCTLCAACVFVECLFSSKCVVSFEIAINILHFMTVILILRTIAAFLSSETIQLLAIVFGNVRQAF